MTNKDYVTVTMEFEFKVPLDETLDFRATSLYFEAIDLLSFDDADEDSSELQINGVVVSSSYCDYTPVELDVNLLNKEELIKFAIGEACE